MKARPLDFYPENHDSVLKEHHLNIHAIHVTFYSTFFVKVTSIAFGGSRYFI
jgi:hypothetical protein